MSHRGVTGAYASLLLSLLGPDQACIAWGRQAPVWAARVSWECFGLQGEGCIYERVRSSHNDKHQPTNFNGQ